VIVPELPSDDSCSVPEVIVTLKLWISVSSQTVNVIGKFKTGGTSTGFPRFFKVMEIPANVLLLEVKTMVGGFETFVAIGRYIDGVIPVNILIGTCMFLQTY
jgi:hypothetical protein